MVSGLLIDSHGNRWPERSWQVARRIGYRDANATLCACAVREHGFIHFARHATGVHISLRAGGVNQLMLGRVLRLLTAERAKRILVSVAGDDGWTFTLVPGIWEFATLVEGLIRRS
jgi:hypothetical protein